MHTATLQPMNPRTTKQEPTNLTTLSKTSLTTKYTAPKLRTVLFSLRGGDCPETPCLVPLRISSENERSLCPENDGYDVVGLQSRRSEANIPLLCNKGYPTIGPGSEGSVFLNF